VGAKRFESLTVTSEAGSAREALTILRRESGIQLVITDQAMPQMTGMQL